MREPIAQATRSFTWFIIRTNQGSRLTKSATVSKKRRCRADAIVLDVDTPVAEGRFCRKINPSNQIHRSQTIAFVNRQAIPLQGDDFYCL